MVEYRFKKKPRGTHCSKGHEFTEENTFIRAYDNARVCRECRKQYAKEKYQKNKEKNGGVARPRKGKNNLTDFSFTATMSEEASEAYGRLLDGINRARLERKVVPCVVNGPEWYTDKPDEVSVDKAEELCYNCPLIKICYDYAVINDEKWGVWGGINFTEEQGGLFKDDF